MTLTATAPDSAGADAVMALDAALEGYNGSAGPEFGMPYCERATSNDYTRAADGGAYAVLHCEDLTGSVKVEPDPASGDYILTLTLDDFSLADVRTRQAAGE